MKSQEKVSNASKIFLSHFFIFVISMMLALVLSTKVSAQEVSSPSAQATDSGVVAYQLPYPGLLPDSPLYFLKAARDKIVSFFISKPLKKADFEITFADKRVEASFLLVQKGKKDLAESTFSKADNYFEDAVVKTQDAKSQGMNVMEVANRLDSSNLKHLEVFMEIQRSLNSSEKKQWSQEKNRMNNFEKKVKVLLK